MGGDERMNREWKPGDVAWWEGERIFREGYNENNPGARWMSATNGECWPEEYVSAEEAPRPLVVIDPEDREAVERLTNALNQFITSGDDYAGGVQAALREFANPTPPIEEPTALYAVVLDRTGNEWCHIGGQVWRSLTSSGQFMVEKHWHDTDSPLEGNVVRILSPGVTS
jgi:hypothetical protein